VLGEIPSLRAPRIAQTNEISEPKCVIKWGFCLRRLSHLRCLDRICGTAPAVRSPLLRRSSSLARAASADGIPLLRLGPLLRPFLSHLRVRGCARKSAFAVHGQTLQNCLCGATLAHVRAHHNWCTSSPFWVLTQSAHRPNVIRGPRGPVQTYQQVYLQYTCIMMGILWSNLLLWRIEKLFFIPGLTRWITNQLLLKCWVMTLMKYWRPSHYGFNFHPKFNSDHTYKSQSMKWIYSRPQTAERCARAQLKKNKKKTIENIFFARRFCRINCIWTKKS